MRKTKHKIDRSQNGRSNKSRVSAVSFTALQTGSNQYCGAQRHSVY